MEIWSYIIGLLPALITGTALFYAQRAQKRRDTRAEEKAISRKEEARLELELILAVAKLSYATAAAVKRGKPNGEMEDAFEVYSAAMQDFKEFEREVLAKMSTE